ncbi:MAG: DUF2249 domain-containing protein [Terracidiphilus sp.]
MTVHASQYLDLRGLDPPDPMRRALEAIEALIPGSTLDVVTDRDPQLLHRELERRHYTYTREIRHDGCHTLVGRRAGRDQP